MQYHIKATYITVMICISPLNFHRKLYNSPMIYQVLLQVVLPAFEHSVQMESGQLLIEHSWCNDKLVLRSFYRKDKSYQPTSTIDEL